MSKRTNNFDRIAPAYDLLASLVFGRSLRKAQTAYLNRIPPGSKVLILGGGTGWLLKELLQTTKSVQIDYVETSPKMIAKANDLLSPRESRHVNFILGDEHRVQGEDHYDVVITFFILDLFKPPRLNRIFQKLDKALRPGGLWLFADFHGKNRWWQKVLMLGMYQFFRWISHVEGDALPDFGHLFEKNRFAEIAGKTYYGDFIGAKVYAKAQA